MPGECVWRVSALLSTSLMVNDSLALMRELFIGRGVSELHMAQVPGLYGCFFFLTASSPLRKGSQTEQLPALWSPCSDVHGSLSRGFTILFFFFFSFYFLPSFVPPFASFSSPGVSQCLISSMPCRRSRHEILGRVAVDRHS